MITVRNDLSNPNNFGFDPVEITNSHFGTNYVFTFDKEFVPGAAITEQLEVLGASNLRYPGGSVTDHEFDFVGWADRPDVQNDALSNMEIFFGTAAQIDASVTLVLPTKFGFDQSMLETLMASGSSSTGNAYGTRTDLTDVAETYLADLIAYISDAMRLASENGVKIAALEVGNEFWGSGQMTAAEYGFLAAEVVKEIRDSFTAAELNGTDILVQVNGSSGDLYSPAQNKIIYTVPDPTHFEHGGHDPYGGFAVRTSSPEGASLTEIAADSPWRANPGGIITYEIAAAGKVQRQTDIIADALVDGGAALLIDGIVDHVYNEHGFYPTTGTDNNGNETVKIGVDGTRNYVLSTVFDDFFDQLDFRLDETINRDEMVYQITEWSTRGKDSPYILGMQFAHMNVEVFYEMVSQGIDRANAWPLTRVGFNKDSRTLIDVSDGELTLAGSVFKMMGESIIGLEAVVDYEIEHQIDIHGYGADHKFVSFVSERSGIKKTGVEIDFGDGDFSPNGSYFVVWTQLWHDGVDEIDDNANPILSYGNGQTGSGGIVTIDLDPWAIARIEMTAITNGADLITGRGGDDSIVGAGGDDTLYGQGGDDDLRGQNGDDVLFGGDGGDTLFGEAGNDKLNGDEGADVLYGGAGTDSFYGGTGNDTMIGGKGADLIDGGEGIDRAQYHLAESAVRADLQYNSANDTGEAAGDQFHLVEDLYGSQFNDSLRGDEGDNSIWGAGGNDELNGRDGNDSFFGGTGNDTLLGGAGNDTLIGGTGGDVFVFESQFDQDQVQDFSNNVDTLFLLNFGLKDAQDALEYATQTGNHTIFEFGGGDTLIVLNVLVADLLDDIFVG